MNWFIFEALMMVCFGFSWPLSIYKTIKEKNPAGKSLWFLWLILLGYLSGIVYKFSQPDGKWVLIIYVINALLVGVDLFFTIKYKRLLAKNAK